MNSAISLIVLLTAVLCCTLQATVIPSPTPDVDPMANAQLVLISAGPESLRSKYGRIVLSDGMHICKEDYPEGLSIECETVNVAGRVRFFVNNKPFNDVWNAPYYIAGTGKNGEVTPWKTDLKRPTVTCMYTKDASVSAKVLMKC